MKKYIEDELIKLAQRFGIDIVLAKSLVSECGDDLDCMKRKLEEYSQNQQIKKFTEAKNGKGSLEDAITKIRKNKKNTKIKP